MLEVCTAQMAKDNGKKTVEAAMPSAADACFHTGVTPAGVDQQR